MPPRSVLCTWDVHLIGPIMDILMALKVMIFQMKYFFTANDWHADHAYAV